MITSFEKDLRKIRACDLRGEGWPDTDIADELGVSRTTIFRWLGPRPKKKDRQQDATSAGRSESMSPSEREDAKSVPHVQPEPQASEPMNGNENE